MIAKLFLGRYRYFWYVLSAGLFALFIYVYYQYNPSEHLYFPKCPIKSFAHLDCPGCGSQRAIHSLLHGDIRSAFKYNALVLPFMPYLALGFGFQFITNPSTRVLYWRKILYGEVAIKIVSVIILLYFIFRNL